MVPVEPPHSIAQARVDDKGRLKLPSEFLEYLKKMGVDKVFITSLDREVARIYPIPVWKGNENFFGNAGDLAELAEDVAYIAKVFGGDSEIDAQGRVLLPAALRRELSLESQPVFLDCYNGRINVAGKAVHEARYHRAMANLGEKVKTLEKKGLK
jgi:MraZ protein